MSDHDTPAQDDRIDGVDWERRSEMSMSKNEGIFNRRRAIKVIIAASAGLAVPLPAATAATVDDPERHDWGGAPIVVALLRDGEIVESTVLPNPSVRQDGYGVSVWGDPVRFKSLSGRYDDARVVLLFAPDAVLAIPIPEFSERIRPLTFGTIDGPDALVIEWAAGPAATISIG
jgi:hypothetical protein